MLIKQRLDRLIVRLCYVRNLFTRYEHQVDFDLDLSSTEAEVNAIYEKALTIYEELNDVNPRN